MATYRLRRKYYSDDGESHLGRNLAIAGGVLGTSALAYAGAKGGLFGGRAQMLTNRFHANMGRKFGSARMQVSGARGYAEGMARRQAHLDGTSFGDMSVEQQKAAVQNNLRVLNGGGKMSGRVKNSTIDAMNNHNWDTMTATAKPAATTTPAATPSATQTANAETVANNTQQQQRNSQQIATGQAEPQQQLPPPAAPQDQNKK